MPVGQKFEALLANLTLTRDQRDGGITNHAGVRSCLNSHYKVDPNDWTVFCRFLASEIPLGMSLFSITQA
jgi:hypothetical protein